MNWKHIPWFSTSYIIDYTSAIYVSWSISTLFVVLDFFGLKNWWRRLLMVLHTSHLDWDEIIRVSAHCNHRGFAASELCMPSSVHYWNLSLTQHWPLVPNAFMNEQKSSWNVENNKEISVCVNLCFVHTFNQHYYASKQEGNPKRGPFLQNKYRVLQLNWHPCTSILNQRPHLWETSVLLLLTRLINCNLMMFLLSPSVVVR